MSLILDRLLPDYQFVERHRVTVAAGPEAAFEQAAAVDLTDSRIARGLMYVWRLAARLVMERVNDRAMSVRDFIPLAYAPPRELVRGLVAGAGKKSWSPEEFTTYNGPGFKLAWGFSVTDLGGRCRVDTETRVFCLDQATKRWFWLYWMVIRLPSGLIRRDLLRIIKRRAEAGDAGVKG